MPPRNNLWNIRSKSSYECWSQRGEVRSHFTDKAVDTQRGGYLSQMTQPLCGGVGTKGSGLHHVFK